MDDIILQHHLQAFQESLIPPAADGKIKTFHVENQYKKLQ